MDTSSKIGAAFLALICSTTTDVSANANAPVSGNLYTNISVIDTRSDRLGLHLSSGNDLVMSFPRKKDYRERYKRIANSAFYKSAYNNRSLGEVTIIED